jgi:hypothetical protein
MGLKHHPRVVTDGLVGYWDAANSRSYSGSGNTWYDLTKNGNNLTLVNSPTYNSSGYFTTGFSGYFTGSGTSSIPSGSSPYTMSCIAQLPNWDVRRGIMSIGGYSSNNGSNAIRTGDTANPGYFYNYWWFNDLYATNNNGNTASGRWFGVSATYDGTTRKIYVNSILVASDTPSAPNVSSTTIQLAKTFNTEYLDGLISSAKIYNRALTQQEILQNYNATKTRYGL